MCRVGGKTLALSRLGFTSQLYNSQLCGFRSMAVFQASVSPSVKWELSSLPPKVSVGMKHVYVRGAQHIRHILKMSGLTRMLSLTESKKECLCLFANQGRGLVVS